MVDLKICCRHCHCHRYCHLLLSSFILSVHVSTITVKVLVVYTYQQHYCEYLLHVTGP